ncbi:MAG: TraR/DksA C4-type zinc finger protein [Paenibacillaceae bacterium]
MHLTEKQRDRLHKQLINRQGEIERQLLNNEHYGLNESMRDSIRELSFYDNHPADIGSEFFERGKDIALNENAEHNLEEVRIAIENMNNGQYGVCLTCKQDIPYARLEAIPWTAYCIKHSPSQQISDNRPAEEEFLTPPFGRTSFDERDDETEFDGEDAWQIVESWGNSTTPAMAEDPEALSYNNLYIESDENIGYVEALESFLATDIYGQSTMVFHNHEFRKYMANDEGDHELEVRRRSSRSSKDD